MIVHTKITYEAMDGKLFTDEDEAYRYENGLIYKKSGFRFYRKDRSIIKDISLCYDEADYFTIDHSKTEANKVLVEMAFDHYGWVFPKDILENTEAKRYRYDYHNGCWRPASRRKKEK